ncbi:MAG: 2,3-bisphosphoglycerate-independent phosphoglycerate mutase [bacterium]
MSYKPVVLTILDGWGVAPANSGNAISEAKTPNFEKCVHNYPAMTIHASGNEVGLLFGEMGNSEVGHLNIGAGRVYYQTCPRINKDINDGSFFKKEAFLQAVRQVKEKGTNLHIIGLISSGNVHSSNDHLYALLQLCKQEKISKRVFVHAILDGRDCVYNSGREFVFELQSKMKELKVGEIASLSGRFYAMDRDNRWERVEKVYLAMAQGVSEQSFENPIKAIEESYAHKVYDEQFMPTVITKMGQPVAVMQDGDSAIFFNFRPDRARQLTKAFVVPSFEKFERKYLKDLFFVSMTEYEKQLPAVPAYMPIVVHNSLAETISKAGLKQFHIAETEKYAHVTFFLNGTVEDPFEGEDRKIIPSPKVSTYDQQPEMSASEVAKQVNKAIDSENYDFIVVNFANPDMVGHTGSLEATIKACETADKYFGSVIENVLAHDGVALVVADHGNAEAMVNLQTGEIDKEHTTNPVPFLIVSKQLMGQAGLAGDVLEGDLSLTQPVGVLADVAPTVLKLLGVDKPEEMTGQALI